MSADRVIDTHSQDLDYNAYLKLHELLRLQHPLAQPECHDETLFIVVHQVFELWFRLILHEVDKICELLDGDDVLESDRLVRRLVSIVRLFVPKLHVLETMLPSDFIAFRDLLKPASGFQSLQFREIEFASGLKDRRYIEMFRSDAEATARLEKRLADPALWDRFVELLKRRGFRVEDEAVQRQAIVTIYRSGRENHDLRLLCEAMIEYDEMFSLWREHHVRMAHRMIGSKTGTGQEFARSVYGTGPMGTMGVEYLAGTLSKRFFPVLWAARSNM